MGDGVTTPISVEDFIPVVSKNYIAPHLVEIPTGTVYKSFKYPRAVLMIPQTPTTTGTVYVYPGASPSSDVSSIPIPAGQLVFLDARGEWYVRTSSTGTEKFLVIDAGGAANAQAVAALLGGGAAAATPVANRNSWYTAQKTVAVPSTPEQCGSQAIPNGFALVVKAMPTNTGNVGIAESQAAADLVTGDPIILAPGESVRLYINNANRVWVDAIVAAEGVCLAAEV